MLIYKNKLKNLQKSKNRKTQKAKAALRYETEDTETSQLYSIPTFVGEDKEISTIQGVDVGVTESDYAKEQFSCVKNDVI